MVSEYYLKTNNLSACVRIWKEEWMDDYEIDLVGCRVDEESAVSNTLRSRVMRQVRAFVKRNNLRLREPHRMFLRLQG